jgi:hypothetical protein
MVYDIQDYWVFGLCPKVQKPNSPELYCCLLIGNKNNVSCNQR